ncbi:MAG: hypothetical protein RSB86_16510 [Comamonas sp.]|jgi:hypothetical protein|uniref:hypothetical protein n=1 Tax=Comamonas sp. TaxID=34028 RepID=UPI002FCA289E
MNTSEKLSLTASKTIPLGVPRGFYAFWSITTQAAFTINFNLKDSSRSYVNASRTSQQILPPLSQAYSEIQGNDLQVIITVAQSQRIDARYTATDIKDDKGQIIARTVTIVGEDATDMDYNDIFFTLTAWRHQG